MFRTILTTSTIFALALGGCVVNDDAGGNEETTGDEPTTTSPTTTSPTTTAPTTTAPTTDTDTTVGPGTDTDTTTMDPDSSSSTTEPEPGPFVFDETPFEDYLQVDRIGFPAVNTGLNLLGDKDEYNQATPADDAVPMFLGNFNDSLHTLHLGVPGMEVADNTGLDDDIAPLATACVAPNDPDDNCDDQAGPFAIPDTLNVDTDDAAGFPNGRRPTDPVIDIILAVLLLDLSVHPVTFLMDIDGDDVPGPSVNPIVNDVENPADFPYFAPAH